MRRTKTAGALVLGALVALLIVGTALAHPGRGIVDRVDVIARALGITADEVEQARDDGTLRDLLADVSKDDLQTAYEEEATSAIDGASMSGDITTAQADRLRELIGTDRDALTDDQIDELRGLRCTVTVDLAGVYASLLGITSEEVEAAKEAGTLRDQLAGVSRVALAAALVDARDAAVDAAEEAGDITSDQAALLRDAGRGFGGCGYGGGKGWGPDGRGGDKGEGWSGRRGDKDEGWSGPGGDKDEGWSGHDGDKGEGWSGRSHRGRFGR